LLQLPLIAATAADCCNCFTAANSISDVDLNEKIVSSLADLEWLKASEFSNVINMITLTVHVKRGLLYSKYLRNLELNFTQVEYFVSVMPYRAAFPAGDFCTLERNDALGQHEFQVRVLYVCVHACVRVCVRCRSVYNRASVCAFVREGRAGGGGRKRLGERVCARV
jgi:hypothetical protein